MVSTTPYGAWVSPITLEMLAEEAVVVAAPRLHQGAGYWTERRPAEGGRTAVMRRRDGQDEEVTPAGFNARTRIHEYGGVPYLPLDEGILAIEFTDQRVYRIAAGDMTPLTPEPEIPAGDRYADLTLHGGVVLAVRERHRATDEPVNEIVSFPVAGGEPRAVASGHDFYASIRPSPDGTKLAWLTWDHPRMPWDGTDLWVADLAEDGTLGTPRHVAGGSTESIFQPEWSPDGVLHWSSDSTGWWNIYREGEPVAPIEAEIGTPQWVFGLARYGFLGDGRIAAVVTVNGQQRLVVIESGAYRFLDIGYDAMPHYMAVAGREVWLTAGNASTPISVVAVDVGSGSVTELKRNFEVAVDPEYFSAPETIEAPTTDGAVTHAFYYPPRNPEYVAPDGELPPLIVMSHGGPTSATTTALALGIQFWTTRGFGVVDVNYRGSTGYGRAYRRALEGEWGIVDTDDCIAAARHLAGIGRVDGARMAITGGSAGGYTTLCALAFHDVFAAGASYYGVADCAALAEHTHKFESRYLDSLIGPYPEQADRYRLRSPLHHADGISCPVLLLQGADDHVVLPEQAEVMVEALAARGVPHAYVLFEGEGHGFRKAENIVTAHAAELSFYGQIFGFTPAGDLPELELSGGATAE